VNEQDNTNFASMYLLIGTQFEERRLIAIYGIDYVDYWSQVPSAAQLRISTIHLISNQVCFGRMVPT